MNCFATATSTLTDFMAGGDPQSFLTGQLDRIHHYGPRLHAFLSVQESAALSALQARHIEGPATQPLFCLPYALKDNIDAIGVPTTCHSAMRIGHVADADSEVKRRLDQAGAICVGKTALHEYAIGGPSFDLPWPPARNPWDERCHPGGSSSGSAVAVATGQVAFAIGTDTAGSVRHPATACGIFGFKPSYEAISMRGVVPLSESMDHLGILARSAKDIALIASVLYEQASDRQTYSRVLQHPSGSLPGLRVGILDAFSLDLTCDPQIRAAFVAILRQLETAGCWLVHLNTPGLPAFTQAGRTLIHAEAYDHLGHLLELSHRPLAARTKQRLLVGREHTLHDYMQALRARKHLTTALQASLATVDVAVSLSSLYLPCDIRNEQALAQTYDAQARTPFNLTGLPAMAIPIGLSSEGLPIGIQLSARAGHDAIVIEAAIAMEEAGLCRFHPPPAYCPTASTHSTQETICTTTSPLPPYSAHAT
ncbi:amidase [Alcaligenaceae bacterium]|nr:amidase [Alcaligenaceae bacterium]